MQLAKIKEDLFNEILEVVSSEQFLHGVKTVPEITYFYKQQKRYSCAVKPVSDFLYSINANNNTTPYTVLNEDIIVKTYRNYVFFDSYTINQYGAAQYTERLTSITDNSPKLDRFVQFLVSNGAEKKEIANLRSHILGAIAENLCMIVQARFLTLQKNFIPAELIYDAYKVGLYPYGWSYEEDSLVCINPYKE